MKLNYHYCFALFLTLILATACEKDDPVEKEDIITPLGYIDTALMVNLGAYELEVETIGEGQTTIVFENGLGDKMEVWKEGVYDGFSEQYQRIIYNRAGYGASTEVLDSMPRDISALARDLSNVITQVSQNEKVILVGHSLGGPIIRAFVELFPDKVEAMLFVDPSHEDEYTEASVIAFQEEALKYGVPETPEFQYIRKEISELHKNWQIMKQLPNLPNIPVTVLTAMSLEDEDDEYSIEERQIWYDLHESLGEGVDDFTHESSEQVGHSIHIDDPSMVIDGILGLIN